MDRKMSIRVMTVDDHAIVREGLIALINRQPDMKVVAEAVSGEQAAELYLKHAPDVTLVDIRLPGMSGIETIRMLKASRSLGAFIALTAFDGDEEIYQALEAGAMSYVLKDAPRDELLSAIRTVHEKKRFIPPPVADSLAARINRSQLTPRERQVLSLMSEGGSNKQIAADLGLSEGTVKGHVNAILTKLNVGDRTEAVLAALRRGFVQLRSFRG